MVVLDAEGSDRNVVSCMSKEFEEFQPLLGEEDDLFEVGDIGGVIGVALSLRRVSMAGLHPGGRSPSKGPAKFASFGCEMHGGIMMVRVDDWSAHIGTYGDPPL